MLVPRRRATLSISILSHELQLGDTFKVDGVTWEVVGHPQTMRGGKAVKARVQRPGVPESHREEYWPAHERITVTRKG